MLAALLVAWIVGGLVIGALGRLLAPGHARMGIAATILVGLAGSFLGGVVGTAIGVGALLRFLLSVAGAALIVSATHGYRHATRRQLPR
jgi:uncharacterized membrane protein YeaQ/YmgE (transglycosylase-associated protein family)